jgi:hypothetical protein
LALNPDAMHAAGHLRLQRGMERERDMFAKENTENARLYPSEIVDQLLTALSRGTDLRADESRKHFYHLDEGNRTFFIYISPINGRVTLITSWMKKRNWKSFVSRLSAHTAWRRWITEHTKIHSYT